jgi:predicted Zn finger-like uncharacterized protein
MNPMEATIPCPHCHKSFQVPLEQIRPGNDRACPNCGATIKFAGDDASKVQQAVEQLARQVGDTAVRVTVKTRARRPWWKFW